LRDSVCSVERSILLGWSAPGKEVEVVMTATRVQRSG
jgi:hypothetical protein